MNTKEKKELGYFPTEIDKAIVARFGAITKPKTEYDFFGEMAYKTTFNANGALRTRIEDFIAGFIAGNLELRGRLEKV